MTLLLWPFFIGFTACASAPSKDLTSKAPDGFEVRYTEFQPAKAKAVARTVIIFPPTGGVTRIEKSYAEALTKRGAKVQVLKNWSQPDTKSLALTLHQDLHERAMRALSMVQQTNPENHKISIFGTSLGGIYAAVATHHFDFIDRVFVVAAGYPVPQIIAKSEHDSMTGLRADRFKKFKFADRDEYAEAIDQVFFLDPSDNPKKHQGKALGVAVLEGDEAVPTETQENLVELWQPEKVIPISGLLKGHFSGIVKTWVFHKNEIAEFLVP